MLDLVLNIIQRETSQQRFNKLMTEKDPKTRKPTKGKETGEPKKVPFIPCSSRKKYPLHASTDVHEDVRITVVLKRGTDLHERYKSEMASLCKKINKMEITIRKKRLQNQFFTDAHVSTPKY